MIRAPILIFMACSLGPPGATALECIKKKPPTSAEAERMASDQAMNDGTLQKGDIVRTDRVFFVFRGIGADGYSNDFVPVANPLTKPKQ
jgi:hypothetical protein